VVGADRVLEFLDSLAEGATGFGEPFGSEDEERDDQNDDQVGGLEDVGEHDAVGRFSGRLSKALAPTLGGVGSSRQVGHEREEGV
jgi:hypothetical protein